MSKHKRSPLQSAVLQAYSAAAENPQERHPFPMGREFATSLGYPYDLLAQLPSISVGAFAGVSNVSVFADIPEGATVLDLGCGAGLDSLIAAKRAGASGQVMGIDFSETMLQRARQGAAEIGADNVEFYRADAYDLTIEDGQVDVALINGIFNLNPEREAIFRELARVVRPGGAVYAAELILREPLPTEVKQNETNWFA
jgi:arsenite methyltransferase